ncbi:MAG: 16S rRNA (guanine(527)-N(7))-methyltransferase RsmG [Candidatus Paracaedibacteraceae bacterium]|nr:16S rRNA (guanine(527)-N(7))-methyltransferase RsmG [Candidatus Paracaedibacteraceae bacterium]
MVSVEQKILEYVSRETYEKFMEYKNIVEEWNRNTSLVQVQTIDQFMERHILDSLQLLPLLNKELATLDIGTGAGFPGMVLAVAGLNKLTLCDSNQRKIIFLLELKRKLGVDVNVICKRVEHLPINSYSQVVTRACADLILLLDQALIVSRETEKSPILYALKGQSVDQEIKKAQEKFKFNYEKINSVTNADGVILKITDISGL